MFRSNQVAILLAGFLFTSVTAALAQESASDPQQMASASTTEAQTCNTCQPQAPVAKAPVSKAPACGCQPQQKGCIAAPEASCIKPRNLPSVSWKEEARVEDAADVVSTTLAQDMIGNAKAVAVIPGVKKGAFIFGGRYGRGLITMRNENGCWIPPSFIQITGGNFGFQAGYQSTDLVLVFTDAEAVRSLLRGKLTLNVLASAASPVAGRQVGAGAPILMNAGIYTFSSSKGLFAGIAVDGATITIDDSSNQRVYGLNVSGTDILMDRAVESNDVVLPFLNALAGYAPGSATQQPSND